MFLRHPKKPGRYTWLQVNNWLTSKNGVFKKKKKTWRPLRKLQNLLPEPALSTIYKAFARPHLEYGHILDYQLYKPFHEKLESVHYNACLAITGSMRCTSMGKLPRIRFRITSVTTLVRKLEMFYKICKNKSPQHLFQLSPEKTQVYATRNVDNIPF